MTDKLIEAVAKAICQSAMDENEVARNTPMNPLVFSRNTAGDESLWATFETDAAAVLAAIEASGFRVVPAEPTEEMLDMVRYDYSEPIVIYKLMLSASPKVTP